MPKHLPNVWWLCYRQSTKQNAAIATVDEGNIAIIVNPSEEDEKQVVVTRRLARMLAQRIQECLADTYR